MLLLLLEGSVSSAPGYPDPKVLNYLVNGVPKLSWSISMPVFIETFPFSFLDDVIIALSS